jgi:hypothetical protein
VLAAAVAISGWSYIAVKYEDGVPIIYFNGNAIAKGKKSESIVHPAPDKAYLKEDASYYNGDMSTPSVYTTALSEEDINKMVAGTPFFEFPSLLLKSPVEESQVC